MSTYSVKGKGWRYDFTHRGIRYTETWFKTKRAANQAEARKREEVKNPKPDQDKPTDITFLDLANKRLDHAKAYNSQSHYTTYKYLARRWVKDWGDLFCSQITQAMVQELVLERRRVSAYAANKDLCHLRATFNYGLKKRFVSSNPTSGIDFFPVEKTIRSVPSSEDIDKVIAEADSDTQDYLWTIRETMARISEVNRLTWKDVNFNEQVVILYTRKKGGAISLPGKCQ